MKRSLSLLLCLLLLFAQAAFAEGLQSISYEVSIEVDSTAFPEEAKHAVAWKTFLEKFSIKGIAHFDKLFQREEIIAGEADIFLNNKLLMDIRHRGNFQYLWIESAALQNQVWHFNLGNYYEFMQKLYLNTGIPTMYIALLSYPNGAFQALRNVYNFVVKHFYVDSTSTNTEGETSSENTNLSEQAAEPLEEAAEGLEETYAHTESMGDHYAIIAPDILMEMAEDAAYFFNEEYVDNFFWQYALSEMLGEGNLEYHFETLLTDMQSASEWLEILSQGEPMYVDVKGTVKSYYLGEHEIIRYDKQEKERHYRLFLPSSPNGFDYVGEMHLIEKDDNFDLNIRFAMESESVPQVVLELNATEIPGENSSQAEGKTQIRYYGESLQNALYQGFRHEYTKDENIYNIKFAIQDGERDAYPFSLKINASLTPFSGNILPSFPTWSPEDFFSLNDYSLLENKSMVYEFVKNLAIPMLIETPKEVFNDLYDYLYDAGFLKNLINH